MERSARTPDARRDQRAGELDRAHGGKQGGQHGGIALTSDAETIVLATPVFGAPLPAEMREEIESLGGVRVVQLSADGRAHDGDDDALADARVILRGGVPASVLDHVLSHAPQVSWIHSVSAGVERVATPAVRSRGITVTNARGVFSRPIAEYVVMMLLAIERRLPQLLELQRDRTWQPLRGRELSEVTVGIVGFGSIGAEVARLLEPFGTRVLATRRHVERGPGDAPNVEIHGWDELDAVLAASDVVLVASPLTDETAGLIGAPQLQAMREQAWLINIARGRLVDETALQRALRSGWIGGAVLDVFSEEPLPPESPLYDTPNLIVTPHTSWASSLVAERSIGLFVDNLRRFVSGEPLLNVVDLEAGY